MNVTRARPQFGAAGLVVLAAVAASCGSAPSASPAALDTVILPVPDAVLDSWAMNAVRWSPDGGRLVVELQDQLVASGRLAVLAADGGRIADLAGNEAAWIDDETLVVRANDPDRFEGPVWVVTPGDARVQPWRIAEGAAWLLAGPRGVNAVDAGAVGPDESFRLLLGRTLGPEVHGRGWPVAFSADGSRLLVEHAANSAQGISLASTGSPELGWVEVLTVPGLERVAAFREPLVERRLPAELDAKGRYAAASAGSGEATVVFGVDDGSVTSVAGPCCPGGWLATGELVAGPFAEGPIVLIDVATGQARQVAQGSRVTASPGDTVAVATGDRGKTLLILRGDRVLARAGFPATIRGMSWRPDGGTLAVTIRGDDPPERLILLPVPDLP
ncbi:MAG TPA: hypothetical protein VER83_01665 [Candidatus Nanopelagicales bacterium]|nr:hypothetical protein [Candidatus Nanopelagicales bacterium]